MCVIFPPRTAMAISANSKSSADPLRARERDMNFISIIAGSFLFLVMLVEAAPTRGDVENFSSMRGANYVPSYARNDVQIWLDFNPAVIDKELGYAEQLKLNTVRV